MSRQTRGVEGGNEKGANHRFKVARISTQGG